MEPCPRLCWCNLFHHLFSYILFPVCAYLLSGLWCSAVVGLPRWLSHAFSEVATFIAADLLVLSYSSSAHQLWLRRTVFLELRFFFHDILIAVFEYSNLITFCKMSGQFCFHSCSCIISHALCSSPCLREVPYFFLAIMCSLISLCPLKPVWVHLRRSHVSTGHCGGLTSFITYSCVRTFPGMKILSVSMCQTINDIDSRSEKHGGEERLWQTVPS